MASAARRINDYYTSSAGLTDETAYVPIRYPRAVTSTHSTGESYFIVPYFASHSSPDEGNLQECTLLPGLSRANVVGATPTELPKGNAIYFAKLLTPTAAPQVADSKDVYVYKVNGLSSAYRVHEFETWNRNELSHSHYDFPSFEGLSITQEDATDDLIPYWAKQTIPALVDLQKLGANWDTYGAKPINVMAISQSLRVLSPIMKANYPSPSVVPMHDGGIQLEWHRNRRDLEIVFPASESPQFYFQNKETDVELEGFASDLETLSKLLKEIA